MVEVPAVAIAAQRFAPEVDFFSIGTNDLAQYTMAAERGNPDVAALIDGPLPPVLRLVALVTRAAAATGAWVGVCGELAGEPGAAALLVGLGVDGAQHGRPAHPGGQGGDPRARRSSTARAAAERAVACDDATEVRALAVRLLGGATGSLLSRRWSLHARAPVRGTSAVADRRAVPTAPSDPGSVPTGDRCRWRVGGKPHADRRRAALGAGPRRRHDPADPAGAGRHGARAGRRRGDRGHRRDRGRGGVLHRRRHRLRRRLPRAPLERHDDARLVPGHDGRQAARLAACSSRSSRSSASRPGSP